MPEYTIKQGDTLPRIAAAAGLGSWQQIHGHAENTGFRSKYSDPNLLFPGETIFVPDRQQRDESASTDQRHQYQYSRPKQKLRIAIEDQDCQRMTSTAYEIAIDGKLTKGTTDGEGIIDLDIAVDAESATLKIGDYRWAIAIGHLNPMTGNTPDSGISGAQGRLRNLGYPVGPVDGIMGPQTQMAIRFFQADELLTVTGKLDQPTRDRLQEVHGL